MNTEETLTGDPKLDGIAGAVMLALSDLTAEQQVKVLRVVTAQGIIITTVNIDIKGVIYDMAAECRALSGYFDGSSGIGALAAKNAKHHTDQLMRLLTRLKSYVR